jgi:hypothetical protein
MSGRAGIVAERPLASILYRSGWGFESDAAPGTNRAGRDLQPAKNRIT